MPAAQPEADAFCSGQVPAATPGVLAKLCKQQGARASRRQGEAHKGNPRMERHVAREQTILVGMEVAAEALGSKARKRGRKAPTRKRKAANVSE